MQNWNVFAESLSNEVDIVTHILLQALALKQIENFI